MDNPICVCVDRNPFPDLEQLVAMIAEVGMSGVEWFEASQEDPWTSRKTAPKIRTLMRRYELHAQYHAPYEAAFDLACDGETLRTPQAVRGVVSQCLEKAERIGARTLTLHLGNCPPGADRADALRRVVEGLLLATPKLERRRMRLALENHTAAILASPLGDRPEEFDSALAQLPAEWIGTTFDVGHAHINGHLDEFLARPFDRLFNTHLHDNAGAQDQHLALGLGTVPWEKVLGRFVQACYRGPLTLEFFCPAEDYARSIGMLRRAK